MQLKINFKNASVQALAQSVPAILSGFIAASLTPSSPAFVASIVMVLAGVAFIVFYRIKPAAVAEDALKQTGAESNY